MCFQMFWHHSSFLQLEGMTPIPPCFTITAAVMSYTLCLDFSPNSSTIVSSEQMISSLMDLFKVLWVSYPLPYCILTEVYGAALPWLMIQDGPLFCRFSIFWRTVGVTFVFLDTSQSSVLFGHYRPSVLQSTSRQIWSKTKVPLKYLKKDRLAVFISNKS